MRQNISTTIVEIDPAVYEAAEKYFALPKPEAGHLFLEDARGWVFNRRRLLNSPEDSSEAETKPGEIPLFDYVIHDCFSGGGVPSHIFTLAFWEDLKAIMAPTASIAIVSNAFSVTLSYRLFHALLIRTLLVISHPTRLERLLLL